MENKSDYTSRKFVFSIITSILIVVIGLLASKYPSITSNYPSIIGGLLGSLTVYCGGNLGALHLNNKMAIATGQASDDDPDDNKSGDNPGNKDADDELAC